MRQRAHPSAGGCRQPLATLFPLCRYVECRVCWFEAHAPVARRCRRKPQQALTHHSIAPALEFPLLASVHPKIIFLYDTQRHVADA